jgi:hypothetical protein
MKKIFFAALLMLVLASPAFAFWGHHDHHRGIHHRVIRHHVKHHPHHHA